MTPIPNPVSSGTLKNVHASTDHRLEEQTKTNIMKVLVLP